MKEGDKSSEGSSNRKVDGSRQSGQGERSRRMAPQLVNDFVDWVELQLPFTPGCLRLTAERIFACRSKKSAVFWLPHSLLRHSRALWSKAKWGAISLASNGEESIIVRVDEKGCCFLLVCPLSPSSAEWMSLNTKSMRVKEVSVRGKDAWMVVEGGVLLSLLLPDQAITCPLALLVFVPSLSSASLPFSWMNSALSDVLIPWMLIIPLENTSIRCSIGASFVFHPLLRLRHVSQSLLLVSSTLMVGVFSILPPRSAHIDLCIVFRLD